LLDRLYLCPYYILYRHHEHPCLHSFPTRRSSDLRASDDCGSASIFRIETISMTSGIPNNPASPTTSYDMPRDSKASISGGNCFLALHNIAAVLAPSLTPSCLIRSARCAASASADSNQLSSTIPASAPERACNLGISWPSAASSRSGCATWLAISKILLLFRHAVVNSSWFAPKASTNENSCPAEAPRNP